MSSISLKTLTRLWQFLLGYTWFIVVWGAFVRASGSGDGCGANWPSCHGELFLPNSTTKTIIEYIHRSTSGLYGLFIFGLVIYTLYYFKKNKLAQIQKLYPKYLFFWLPFLTLFLTLLEALIGAKLVLSGLVGSNESWARALVMIFHLVNTLLLVASIVGTLHLIQPPKNSVVIKSLSKHFYLINTLGLILVASFGALTALGDTLYPSASLAEGIQKDIAENAPWIIRLRVLHPLLALGTVFGITYMVFEHYKQKHIRSLLFWSFSTLFIGLINLLLLAPIYMQLIHLLWAQILWCEYVGLGFKNYSAFKL